MNDIYYNLNLLKQNLKFTILCVGVIAIGLAIAISFYSLTDNLYLKSLDFDQGDRFTVFKPLGTLENNSDPVPSFDLFHYYFYKENATSYQTIEAWQNISANISDGDYAQSYTGSRISADLLQRTGVQPVLGRLINADDTASDAEPVVLLSFNVWQNYYSARQDIIGYRSRINGEMRTVIGVMPEGFNFPLNQNIWLPLRLPQSALPGDDAERVVITGVLRESISVEQARVEAQTMEAQIQANWPTEYEGSGNAIVVPYAGMFFFPQAAAIELFIALVMICLVAFNAGNLFLARGEERLQELAVRSALGATPARVAKALMQESFAICLLGLVFGLGLTALALNYLDGLLLNQLAVVFWWDMSLDSTLVLLATLTVFIIWLFSGCIPAWRVCRSEINDILCNGSKGASIKTNTRLSKILVNLQIIFGCVLLIIGCSFTIEGFKITTDFGVNTDNIYTGNINLSGDQFNSEPAKLDYLGNLRQALSNQPGIETVSFTTDLPGSGAPRVTYTIEDRDLKFDDSYPQQFLVSIANNYFNTLGVDLLQGRMFTTQDTTDSLPVAIVDERLAERLWTDESEIGKRIRINPDNGSEAESPWLTVVGVVSAIVQDRAINTDQEGTPVLYLPITQSVPGRVSIIYTSSQADFDFIQPLRTAATSADRDIPVNGIQSLEQVIDGIISGDNLSKNIAIALMLVATFLTAAATYGLSSRAIGRRQVEIGIRRAMGASELDALGLFIKEGAWTIATGLGIGSLLGVLISYGVMTSAQGASAFGLILWASLWVCVILGSIVFFAHYLPARKIIAMEPGDALRYE